MERFVLWGNEDEIRAILERFEAPVVDEGTSA
jgi:hypothetical protein